MRSPSALAEGTTRLCGRLTAALAVAVVALFASATTSAVLRSARPVAATGGHVALGSGGAAVPPGAPVRVRIPAIGVDAPLDGLGLNGDGTLQVPDYQRAGWYRDGPKPGAVGPAVIAAHVDSTTGPAVFYRLRAVHPGNTVAVDYADGTAVVFEVRSSDSYPKSHFPSELVYRATDTPQLRLITCDGSFDRRARSYRENLVVWATETPASERSAGSERPVPTATAPSISSAQPMPGVAPPHTGDPRSDHNVRYGTTSSGSRSGRTLHRVHRTGRLWGQGPVVRSNRPVVRTTRVDRGGA